MTSDGRTFLSADDLRIHWWDLEVSDQSFNVVDTKPKCVEDLTEVLTVAKFHPISCHTLVYGTSKGIPPPLLPPNLLPSPPPPSPS